MNWFFKKFLVVAYGANWRVLLFRWEKRESNCLRCVQTSSLILRPWQRVARLLHKVHIEFITRIHWRKIFARTRLEEDPWKHQGWTQILQFLHSTIFVGIRGVAVCILHFQKFTLACGLSSLYLNCVLSLKYCNARASVLFWYMCHLKSKYSYVNKPKLLSIAAHCNSTVKRIWHSG